MLFWLGCVEQEIPLVVNEVVVGEPQIVDATVECQTNDSGGANWEFVIKTDAWTGNGKVIFSADGSYTEVHPIYSVESGAAGLWDRLEGVLTVVADRDDVGLGGSTWFNCEQPELAGILQVMSRDGEDVSDCRRFREPDPGAWNGDAWGYGCETVLETD